VDRVPVLIVSGFLGSGKTTLVRRLLEQAQQEGVRVAVVSNEFGELGIDEALLGAGDQRFVELAGGCVCCQLSDELVDTLEELRARVRPDRVVIETSGLALPHETQLNLYRPPVSAWVGDEAAVVVVNAEQVLLGEHLDGTFEDQVGSADLLVLHKVDLVPEASLDEIEARLLTLNPGVPIVRASFGEVPHAVLFPGGPSTRGSGARACGDAHEHSHTHAHVAWISEELEVPSGLDEDAVLAWIEARRGVRTKGFVRTTAGDRVVQGVGRRLELLPMLDLDVPEALFGPAGGRVVVIRPGTGA
jgi:cobalamin biosynthesis protein CobW